MYRSYEIMVHQTIPNILNIVLFSGIILMVSSYYPKLESVFPPDENLTGTAENNIIFYDASEFEILGQLPDTETYTRLPLSAQNKVRQAVWDLSQHTAGISIRFISNSSTIKIRWKLKYSNHLSNLTPIATKGLDLYANRDNKWQFVGVARPSEGHQNEVIIIEGMPANAQEYLLNLPLYDGVLSLEIGIDSGAFIDKPAQKIIDTAHPFVFYGTSITQGASASRPGLTYPALIERQFNKEVINLGFSGNGRFEKAIAEYIMTAQPSMVILDCTPNSPADTIRKNLPETIDYITAVNDTVPIILVESIIRDDAFFRKEDQNVPGTMSFINEQNKALKSVFESKIKTRKNIFYLDSENLIGEDHEATIDGTHFNDLGHYRAYQKFREEIEKILGPN
jgi:hypothetical protein